MAWEDAAAEVVLERLSDPLFGERFEAALERYVPAPERPGAAEVAAALREDVERWIRAV